VINLQNAYEEEATLPTDSQLEQWVDAVLQELKIDKDLELTIRAVGLKESAGLNKIYRKINKPTNVLSFPFNPPPFLKSNTLGDLVICVPVVIKEAKKQHKTEESHWAHLIIHGMLHLFGHDHEDAMSAQKMEDLEIKIMQEIGFANPYS